MKIAMSRLTLTCLPTSSMVMAVAENGWKIILVPTLLFAYLWLQHITAPNKLQLKWKISLKTSSRSQFIWYSVLVQDKYGTMILFTSHKRQFSRGKRYLHIFTKIESIIFHTAPYFLYTINNHYTFSYCLTCVIAAFSERQLNGLYLLWHSWQHSLLQTVELIKAAPGTNLTETYKDTAHGLGKR